MSIPQDIHFCKACMTDPLGRVFFYHGRVFRAIDPKCEARFLNFLQSELYRKLLEKGWIVKTWVTKEISIEGYSLIVEHERMFVSRPQEWSFEMQKEVAITTLKMLKLCNQYGYTFGDAMSGNFAFRDGQPVLIDIGALKEGTRDNEFDTQFALWQYMLLSAYLHNGGCGIDSLMHGQGKVYRTRFPQNRNFVPYMLSLYSGAIDYYYIYHHVNTWRIKVRSSLWFFIVQCINEFARRLSIKIGSRELLKCGLIQYKSFAAKDIKRLRSPYRNCRSFFDVDEWDKVKVALSSKQIDYVGKSVVCIGNFEYDGLWALQNTTGNSVTVITHDMCYADTLFTKVHEHKTDINILCMDPVNANAENEALIQNCCGDIVIIQSFWEIFTTNSKVTFPVYHTETVVEMLVSISKRYVLVPNIASEHIKLSERHFERIESLHQDEIVIDVYELREHHLV